MVRVWKESEVGVVVVERLDCGVGLESRRADCFPLAPLLARLPD